MSNPKPYRRSWIEQIAYDGQETAFALMRQRQALQAQRRIEAVQRLADAQETPFRRSAVHVAADARRASAFPCPR